MEHRKLSDHSSVKKTEDPYHVYYENYLDTNACTECTGLTPNAAHNREEWDAYRESLISPPSLRLRTAQRNLCPQKTACRKRPVIDHTGGHS